MAAPRLLDATGNPLPPMRPNGQPGGQRGRQRADLGSMRGQAYDAGAAVTQEMADWFPQLKPADAEVGQDRDRMVARQRDLVRNDGWATGTINRTVDAMIGAQFRLNARPAWRTLQRLDARFDATWAAEFSAAAEAEFGLWAEDQGKWCDAARKLTLHQLFWLAARHKLVDGEIPAVLLWAPERVGAGAARFATTVQLMDPDRLSNPDGSMNTPTLRDGVELDGLGAPIAYWFRRTHPNDPWPSTDLVRWQRLPRETPWGRPIVVHDHDMERVGQNRGAGLLAPVLARFRMLAKFDQASLAAAVLRTMVGFFLKSPYDAQEVQDALDVMKLPNGAAVPETMFAYQQLRNQVHGDNPVMLGGVRIGTLAPGEDVVTVKAGDHAQEFETFEHAFLRSVAAAAGTSAEEVTNDYRKVNYSSGRLSLLTAWRTLVRRRGGFGAGFASPIYGGWLEEAVVEQRLLPMPRGIGLLEFAAWRAAFARCSWIGPGRGWVDPTKERQGELLGLQAGFGTLEDTCADISGRDWREVLEQRAVEEAEMRRLGLTLPDWAGGRNMAPAPDAPTDAGADASEQEPAA